MVALLNFWVIITIKTIGSLGFLFSSSLFVCKYVMHHLEKKKKKEASMGH